MRVGLFIDTFNLGGAEVMMLELASLLIDKGCEPVLLHFGSEYVKKYALSHNIEEYEIPHRKEYKKTVLLPVFAIKLRPFLLKLKLDCMHSHLYGPIVAMGLACFVARVKHVGTLHDVFTIEERPARIHLLKLVVFLGTRLIAVSSPMLSFYVKAGKFNLKEIVHIANYSPELNKADNGEELRNTLGLPATECIVMSVGRLVELKQFDHLVLAVKQMQHNVHLVIVGQGPELQALEALVQELDLQKKVSFLGERNDVAHMLRQANIFALVSRTEGLSMSILEALAAGLPVVATQVGGNSDLVENGQNGILVENGNIEQIARSLDLLVENSATRKRFGDYSESMAKTKFGKEKFVQSHIEYYQG